MEKNNLRWQDSVKFSKQQQNEFFSAFEKLKEYSPFIAHLQDAKRLGLVQPFFAYRITFKSLLDFSQQVFPPTVSWDALRGKYANKSK